MDADGEVGTHAGSIGEPIAGFRCSEVLVSGIADTFASRISGTGRTDSSSVGVRRIDARGAGAGPSPASGARATAPRVRCWLGAARVETLGAGAAHRGVEHGVDADAGDGSDAGIEGARAGDLAP